MKKNIIIVLLISLFLAYCAYFLQNKMVFLDGQSIYYPVLTLLKTSGLNMGDSFNALYNTFYFKYIFSDTVFNIQGNNEIYPLQPISVILYYGVYMSFFGQQFFFYINLFFAVGAALFFYLTIKQIFSWRAMNYLTLLLFMFLPTFLLYTILPQVIIPTIFFLFGTIFFLVKYIKTKKDMYWFFAILLFLWSCLLKPSMAIFGLLFIPFAFTVRNFSVGIILSSIMVGVLFLLNFKYFGDPTFIGYLHINDRPYITEYGPLSQPVYLSGYTSFLTSFEGLLNTFLKFFKGSFFVFSPTLLLSILAIFRIKTIKNSEVKKLFIMFLIVFIINLLYYSNMESQLWVDSRGDFSLSLSLAFFRYLTPIWLLMIIFVPLFFQFFRKTGKLTLLVFFFVSLQLLLIYPMYYTGGASLRYFKEIQDKRVDFSKQLNANKSIVKGSVILFDERPVQYYLYPHVEDYHWFCYYCIPPGIRNDHTHQILKKLIDDNKNIYFGSFGSPYNALSQEMENYLHKNFVLEIVEETKFEREKFIFYKIIDEKKDINPFS